MSVRQGQTHQSTRYRDAGRWFVPVKDNGIFKCVPNAFGITDDILIVKHDAR